jgi:hypothetical protein
MPGGAEEHQERVLGGSRSPRSRRRHDGPVCAGAPQRSGSPAAPGISRCRGGGVRAWRSRDWSSGVGVVAPTGPRWGRAVQSAGTSCKARAASVRQRPVPPNVLRAMRSRAGEHSHAGSWSATGCQLLLPEIQQPDRRSCRSGSQDPRSTPTRPEGPLRWAGLRVNLCALVGRARGGIPGTCLASERSDPRAAGGSSPVVRNFEFRSSRDSCGRPPPDAPEQAPREAKEMRA